jgi:sugar/nucleoside kinase (ribokinase family)
VGGVCAARSASDGVVRYTAAEKATAAAARFILNPPTIHPPPAHKPHPPRAVPLLPHLTYITPNAEELLAIAAALKSSQPSGGRTAAAATAAAAGGGGGRGGGGGAAARRLADLAPAAAAVLAAGVKCILLTMGEHGAALLRLEGGASGGACCGGVCCGGACCGGAGGCGCGSCGAAPCTTTTSSTTTSSSNAASRRPAVVAHHLPSPPARVVSVSGAGDCLAAAFAAALARGGAPCATPEQGLREGLLAARAAVESEGNVPSRARLVGAVRGGGGGGPAGEMAVLTFPVASML